MLVIALWTIGCAGGGGSTGVPAITTVPAITAAPTPAAFPTTPPPTGLTLDGSSGSYPTNASFPAYIAYQPSGAAPVLTQDGSANFSTSGSVTSLQLVIPALNIRATLVPDYSKGLDRLKNDFQDGIADHFSAGPSYVGTGSWAANSISAPAVQFLFGIETPASAIPSTGQASFAAVTSGYVNNSIVFGDASFSVDFGSATLTGGFKNMRTLPAPGGPYTPWNDVSVTAAIAAGSSRFNGSTAVTSSPATPLSLSLSATGKIAGGFFGPAAQDLGGVWTLNDGTSSAIGLVTGYSR